MRTSTSSRPLLWNFTPPLHRKASSPMSVRAISSCTLISIFARALLAPDAMPSSTPQGVCDTPRSSLQCCGAVAYERS
jgi:hypothetical protein